MTQAARRRGPRILVLECQRWLRGSGSTATQAVDLASLCLAGVASSGSTAVGRDRDRDNDTRHTSRRGHDDTILANLDMVS
uniref:Uncharacterized protein n=1 Tax=Oryza glumipatula TaxID=40148 RepID=A0A0D9YC81_9ORYZ